MKRMVFKSDKYKKARGGYSRLLEICCAKCGTKICFYQKDGPGMLKRMYVDRMIGTNRTIKLQALPVKALPQLTCTHCEDLIGIPFIYKKESRPAYRLFVGSVTKKIRSIDSL